MFFEDFTVKTFKWRYLGPQRELTVEISLEWCPINMCSNAGRRMRWFNRLIWGISFPWFRGFGRGVVSDFLESVRKVFPAGFEWFCTRLTFLHEIPGTHTSIRGWAPEQFENIPQTKLRMVLPGDFIIFISSANRGILETGVQPGRNPIHFTQFN